jgi:hypothetical protein
MDCAARFIVWHESLPSKFVQEFKGSKVQGVQNVSDVPVVSVVPMVPVVQAVESVQGVQSDCNVQAMRSFKVP